MLLTFIEVVAADACHRIFLIFFSNSLGQQTSNNVLRYVTSSFDLLSLTATTGIVSQLVAGVIKLPVAKLMDVWGRPQGYLLMLLCAVIGTCAWHE